MSRIERSNQRGKFTEGDLRARVRESREYWNSPTGQRRAAELARESRSRKSPATPATTGSRAYWMRRAALLEKNAPKIQY